MRFEEIMAFLAVSEHGSLTRAAESLYITQPTLSNQISALEKELEVQLVIRNKGQRQIELTPAGKAFIVQADKWRKLWLETKASFTSTEHDTLRISSTTSLGNVFRDVYQRFIKRELPCSVWMTLSRSLDMYMRISQDEVDLGLLCNATFYPETISVPVAYEQLVFCCGIDSSYDYLVKTKDLDAKKEMYIPWNSDFRQWHSFWFSGQDKPPLETENIILALDFLSHKDNWAILPISVAESPDLQNKIRICELDFPPKGRTIYVVSKLNHPTPYYDFILADLYASLRNRNGISLIQRD